MRSSELFAVLLATIMSTFVGYLHLIAVFCLAGALVIENMAVKEIISGEDARNLARVDAVYGASAIAVLVFGLSLWLWTGKPAEFYSSNPIFHAKLGLFGLIAILSIYPAMFFIKHRKSECERIEVPGSIQLLLKLELALLLIVPVLAFLMARGVGLSV